MKNGDAGDLRDQLEDLKCRMPSLVGILDRQSLRILESLNLNTFENFLNAFEEFIEDAPLFKGDTTFAKAANALDSTALLFDKLDKDKDHMLGREDLALLLLNPTNRDYQSLRWLIDHFDAFTRACFFKDRITKDDLEAARNVFHGLRVVHDKFGFDEEASPENLQHLNRQKIRDYLREKHNIMEPHDKAGLEQLIHYMEKHAG